MDEPDYGRIIWLADVIDPQGNHAGRHAAIILTSNEEREAGRPIKAVVVSTKLHRANPEEMVMMRWAKGKHPHTGFDKKCAAMGGWIVEVDLASIVSYGALIWGELMDQVVDCVKLVEGKQKSSSKES